MNQNGRLDSVLGEGKKINFNNVFVTEVFYKNGAKETINHIKPPQPDTNRMVHFQINDSCGVAINLDEIRKFQTVAKSIAAVSEIEIITP